MELEIAGLVDRPSVDLPIYEKLEQLKLRQEGTKDLRRGILKVHANQDTENVYYSGDLIFRWARHQDPGALSSSVDVGQACGGFIKWWTICVPCPLKRFSVNITEGVIALLEGLRWVSNLCVGVIPVHALHYRVHVVSIESGVSMLDEGYLSIPTPTMGQWSARCITSVEKVIAVELKPGGQKSLGITIMSWNNSGPRVVSGSFLPLLHPALGI